MGEPIALAERAFVVGNSVTITGLTIDPLTGIATVTVAATHPFQSGQRITHAKVGGFTDDFNDLWLTERISATQYFAKGTTATGTFTSGGTATYSAEDFAAMDGPVEDRTFGPTSQPSGALGMWQWKQDRFIFPGATVARQLRITYRVSDSLPTSDNGPLGVDGCLPFLKFRIAGLALTNLAPDTAAGFNREALGPNGQAKDLDGLLGSLIRPQIRTGQRLPIQRKPYRPRRSTGPIRLVGIG
jgi:hypothetical protein